MLSNLNKCPFCDIPCGMEHCPYTAKQVQIPEIIEECDTCLEKIKKLQGDNLTLNELIQQLHDKINVKGF